MIHYIQSVTIHSKTGAIKAREFISSNEFAEHYGAPLGKKLNGPDDAIKEVVFWLID